MTLVYCGQTVGWINKMKLGTEVGLGPGQIVLDGDPAPLPQKGSTAPQFLAHVYCGQTAGWIKMPVDTKVGLGHGTLLDGDPALPGKGHSSPPLYSPCLATVAYLSCCQALVMADIVSSK